MAKKGESPSQHSRKLARHSNPHSCAVKTPDGIFRSINECAEYYNRSTSSILHRLKIGAQQRKTNKSSTSHHNDWRGWEVWGKSTKIPKRPVRTPLGEFESMTAAAAAHKTAVCTIRKRCLVKMEGYEIIEEKK